MNAGDRVSQQLLERGRRYTVGEAAAVPWRYGLALATSPYGAVQVRWDDGSVEWVDSLDAHTLAREGPGSDAELAETAEARAAAAADEERRLRRFEEAAARHRHQFGLPSPSRVAYDQRWGW